MAVLAGSISWSSSRLVSRLDAVEATVEVIQDSMDMRPFARVEDVTEATVFRLRSVALEAADRP